MVKPIASQAKAGAGNKVSVIPPGEIGTAGGKVILYYVARHLQTAIPHSKGRMIRTQIEPSLISEISGGIEVRQAAEGLFISAVFVKLFRYGIM